MSRSYRRFHTVKDRGNKSQKQIANKHFRRNYKEELLQNGTYKKTYPQWDICDFNWRWTKEDAIAEWYEEETDHYINGRGNCAWRHKQFKTLENWLNYWSKCVQRK